MSTMSLLDAIERPSILGPDRGDRGGARRHDRDDRGRDRDDRGRDRDDRGHDRRDRDLPRVGGGPTLDEVLTGTWDALISGRPAACPVCDAPLQPRYSAGHAPVAGRCTRCGSELS